MKKNNDKDRQDRWLFNMKIIMIALAIGLFALSLVAANAHAEPIDSPVGPRSI